MFESGAIVAYLCDRHPEKALAPEPSSRQRARYLQWLFFLTDTLYPAYNRYYWPARYTTVAHGAQGVKEAASEAALRFWQVIENALELEGPWLLGDRFSACDIYLQMVTTWHESPADLLGKFPRIKALSSSVLEREGSRRAFERHNFPSGLD